MISIGNKPKAHCFLKPVGKITSHGLWAVISPQETEVKKIAILSLMVLMWAHIHCLVAPQPAHSLYIHTNPINRHPNVHPAPGTAWPCAAVQAPKHIPCMGKCSRMLSACKCWCLCTHRVLVVTCAYINIHVIYSNLAPFNSYSYQPSQRH